MFRVSSKLLQMCPHGFAVQSPKIWPNQLTGLGKISTSAILNHIMKLTRLRVVDNSTIGKQAMLEGKPPKCIHVYTKTSIGTIGDKVLIAIKGEKKKAIIVGVKQAQKHMVPRFDSNNIVLINEDGTPLGTRIHAPIPSLLRGKVGEYAKLIAIATKFV